MNIDLNDLAIEIIRSDRKSISVKVTSEAGLQVRAPRQMDQASIDEFLLSRRKWIEKHVEKRRREIAETPEFELLSTQEVQRLVSAALKDLPKRVERYAPVVGVDYGRITIRNQRSRWGSCSGKGNLNFNCLLMLMPERIRDYVVVHELCHRIEMNHSAAFWQQVERVFPDFRECRKWLRDNGEQVMRRMTG